MVQEGLRLGWSSPNIASFTSNTSEISLTQDEVSWIASCSYIGGAFGSVFGPLSVKFLGPKQTGLMAFVIFSASWTCILLAKSFILLLIGRLIGGFCGIVAYVCTAIFLGEISKPEIRGTIISIVLTGGAVGRLLATYLEAYYSPKITCPVYLVQCFVGVIMLMFVLPEYPYFLMKSGNLVKTRKSITTYFPNENVEEKLLAIKMFLEMKASLSVKDATEKLKSIPIVKPLLFIVILSCLLESSGYSSVGIYMESILIRGKATIVEPKKVVIFDNFLIFFVRLMTCNVIDKIGRKILLIITSILIATEFFCLGVYFYLLHSNFDLDCFQYVPIVCILMFQTSFSIGFFTSFHTLLSELFPANVKSLAMSLSSLSGSFVGFALTKIFLPISDLFGEQYMFWTHSLCAILVAPFVIFLLPETKGRKLEEIGQRSCKQ